MKRTNGIAVSVLLAGAMLQVGCGAPQSSFSGSSTLTYNVTNSCYDGNTIYYRFFDETNNLVWPAASTYYYSTQGKTYSPALQCKTGAKICFGASENTLTDTPYWGVGSNNSHACTNCCVTCETATVTGTMSCSAGAAAVPHFQSGRP